MSDVYLKRDNDDPNNYWVGVKSTVKPNVYYWWSPIFVDALSELFDPIATWARDMKPGEIVAVEMTMRRAEQR